MKRLAWTVGALLLAGLLLVAGAALPVEQPVATEIPVSGRVTAMCPAFTGATASTVVAAAGTGVDTATLAQPSDRSAVTGLATLNSSDAAVRVVTTWGQAGGGATGLTSESGPERGLSLSGCLEPAAQWWFAGVTSNATHQAELVLVNADADEAAVDVAIYGPDGRVSATGGRGLVVNPNSERTVALGPLVTSDASLSLDVTTSSGRVAAFVRVHEWSDTTGVGADWIAPTAMPGTDAVLPGVLGGAGPRTLVVTNTEERTARLTVSFLGATGRLGVLGSESLDVPAGATRSFQLAAALGGQPGALEVASDRAVVAALVQHTADDAAAGDFTVAGATSPLAAPTIVPVPLTKAASVGVVLANTGTDPIQVPLRVLDSMGMETFTQQVTLPAGAALTVAIPSGDNPIVELPSGIYAAIVATQTAADIPFAAVLGVVEPTGSAAGAQLARFDPHA